MRVVPTKLPLYWERFHSPAWRDLRTIRNETAEREAHKGKWLKFSQIEMWGSALIVYLATGIDDLPTT